MRMLGSPPLPQPVDERVVRVMRSAPKKVRARVVRRCCGGVFQKKRREAGRRQRRVWLRACGVWACELRELIVGDGVDGGDGVLGGCR